MVHATVSFDGASRGNPGPMAGAAVVDIGGKATTVATRPGRGTNNEAEYDGIIVGLEEALRRGAATVTLRGDSQLIIRQLDGRYKVKAPNLQSRFRQANALLARFDAVRFQWIRREQNERADAAANAALDA